MKLKRKFVCGHVSMRHIWRGSTCVEKKTVEYIQCFVEWRAGKPKATYG